MNFQIQPHEDGRVSLLSAECGIDEMPQQIDLSPAEQRRLVAMLDALSGMGEAPRDELGLECEHVLVDFDFEEITIYQTRLEGMSGKDEKIKIPWIQFGAFLRMLDTAKTMRERGE